VFSSRVPPFQAQRTQSARHVSLHYIKIDIQYNSPEELKANLCHSSDENFLNFFAAKHKFFRFSSPKKHTDSVYIPKIVF